MFSVTRYLRNSKKKIFSSKKSPCMFIIILVDGYEFCPDDFGDRASELLDNCTDYNNISCPFVDVSIAGAW